METVQEFDTSKYYLGSLCKRGHDWNGTGQSLRYITSPGCAQCILETKRIRHGKPASGDPGGKPCPFPECANNGKYDALIYHFISKHGFKDKTAILESGIVQENDLVLSEKQLETLRQNGKLNREENRDPIVAKIYKGGHGYIIVPEEYWTHGCLFTKIIIDKKRNVVEFRPHIKKLKNYRRVYKQSCQYYIHIADSLVEALNGGAGIFHITEGRLEIHLEDPSLLPWFEAWSKSWGGKGIKNPSDLQIFPKCRKILINNSVWPIYGQYASIGFNRKSIFLKPLKKKGGYGDLTLKVSGLRYMLTAVRFFNNAPPNLPKDWQLKEILPDGTLRFSPWGKGRKVTPKPINPVIDHEETPKQLPSDYVPFEEWEGLD